MVIPALMPSESDYHVFEDEPNAFVEMNFVFFYTGNRTKMRITEFLDDLSKFYQDELQSVLDNILQELASNRSFQ